MREPTSIEILSRYVLAARRGRVRFVRVVVCSVALLTGRVGRLTPRITWHDGWTIGKPKTGRAGAPELFGTTVKIGNKR